MPHPYFVDTRRKIRYRELPVFIGDRVVRIVHNSHVAAHPAVNIALGINEAHFLELVFVHLAFYGLRDVKETLIILIEVNVVQYGVAVQDRDLRIDSHDLNVRRVFAPGLIDLRVLRGRRNRLSAFHTLDDDDCVLQTTRSVHDQLLGLARTSAAHVGILVQRPGRQFWNRARNGYRS